MTEIEKLRVVCNIPVEASAQEAFLMFTEKFQTWWPQDYTLSKGSLDKIGIEPKLGGLCFEIGPFGFRCDWGKVLVWEPPNKLALTWQINQSSAPEPNPELASEVWINFTEVDSTTTVLQLEHLHFERHGESGIAYRDEMASEYGWSYILKLYQAKLNGV